MTSTSYAVPPVDYLREWLGAEPTRWRQLTTVALLVVNLGGRFPITAPTAVCLERLTGIPADSWLRYEAAYRADLQRLFRQVLIEVMADLQRDPDGVCHACSEPVTEQDWPAHAADAVIELLQILNPGRTPAMTTTTPTTIDTPQGTEGYTIEHYTNDRYQLGWPTTTVAASQVRVGDFLVQSTGIGRVTSVDEFDLAWRDGRPIEVSGTESGRWRVVKIDAAPAGVVAFPYSPVTVVRREDWHGVGESR